MNAEVRGVGVAMAAQYIQVRIWRHMLEVKLESERDKPTPLLNIRAYVRGNGRGLYYINGLL